MIKVRIMTAIEVEDTDTGRIAFLSTDMQECSYENLLEVADDLGTRIFLDVEAELNRRKGN